MYKLAKQHWNPYSEGVKVHKELIRYDVCGFTILDRYTDVCKKFTISRHEVSKLK